jgi:hypothetical protein
VWLHNLYVRAASNEAASDVGIAIDWAPIEAPKKPATSRLWMTNVTLEGGRIGLKSLAAVFAAGVHLA